MISKQRLLDRFVEMVQVDSPSREEKPMADWLMNYLKNKGIEATIDDAGSKYGGNSGNIVAYIPGKPGEMPLCFAAHMDQISPCKGVKPQIDGDIVRSDETTTLGADDKGGIAAILEALEDVLEENAEHRDIYLLFTVSEEIGMHGVKHFDANRLPCKDIIVLDAGGATGTIAYKAPAQMKIKATFHGVKAHAGIEPEKGINAIVVASNAISKMRIGRIDSTTTSNIGRIEGGDATNIVTDEVYFTAEIRAHDSARLKEELSYMEKCCLDAAAQYGVSCDFHSEESYPSFELDMNSPLFAMTVKAHEDAGVKPEPVVIGGGSDANILAKQGYRSAIISLGMYDVHTVNEYLNVEDCYKAAQVCSNLMKL